MQLPSNLIHSSFSEIDVNNKNGKLEIACSTMIGLTGEISEEWKTGISIDASVSMYDFFGKGLRGTVPENEKKNYKKKGWIQTRKHDGANVDYWLEDAFKDALKKGYLTQTTNIVEKEARKFSSYLAENLDYENKTDLIYWALGENGQGIEEIGVYDNIYCKKVLFDGPKKHIFGQATHLFPAVKYFENKYRNAKRGLFIFISDGKIDDLDTLKKFTVNLAKEIESGKRNFFKAIIIGLGDKIDESQMIELDDLDTGTSVDIWDHKIAHEMKSIIEIFAELVDENTIIAPLGIIYDSNGKVVKKFNDGLPAKFKFELDSNNDSFTLEVGNQSIKQVIRKV